MASQRFVTVKFRQDGHVTREDYGPFLSSEEMMGWFDRRDTDQRFGPGVRYNIRRLGIPDTPPSPARKRTAKKVG